MTALPQDPRQPGGLILLLVQQLNKHTTLMHHCIRRTSLRTRMLCFFAEAKFFCGCFLAMLRSEKPPSMVPKPLAIQCTCVLRAI